MLRSMVFDSREYVTRLSPELAASLPERAARGKRL
jgi:hypothetical protein